MAQAIYAHQIMKAITTRYHGPSNVRGIRIIARAEGEHRTISSMCDELGIDDNHYVAASTLQQKLGWKGELIGGYTHRGEYVWVMQPALQKAGGQ